MSAENTKAGEGTATSTLIALGTLIASGVGFVKKARQARGSSDLLDHADVIAACTSFVVLLARARRERTSSAV